MIQNLLILKKGIPGFVYAKISIEENVPEEPEITIVVSNE